MRVEKNNQPQTKANWLSKKDKRMSYSILSRIMQQWAGDMV